MLVTAETQAVLVELHASLDQDDPAADALALVLDLLTTDTWVSLDDVRARWADAPLDDSMLASMLAAAHEQCVAYAPVLAEGTQPPSRYLEAEVLQVRALGQSQLRDGDVLGFGDGFAVRVRPLGEDVKALLRPRIGKPRLG